MNTQQSLAALNMVVRSPYKPLAAVVNTVLSVWTQYQDSAVDPDDWRSILERNLERIYQLEPTPLNSITIQALRNLR